MTIGLQGITLLGLSLFVLLLAFAAYVKIKQTTYTEKRFNFVALWSCIVLVSTYAPGEGRGSDS